ncbi:hypothetical protein MJM83_32365, partial [Salmonella enterica subsp. enterica serovar Montevideo]|nr:hypothetical protein [Salmonella enterica subsp. enterica serovar Montevideo]
AATWLGITMGLGAALTFIVAFWTATILLIIGLSIPDRLKARRCCIGSVTVVGDIF